MYILTDDFFVPGYLNWHMSKWFNSLPLVTLSKATVSIDLCWWHDESNQPIGRQKVQWTLRCSDFCLLREMVCVPISADKFHFCQITLSDIRNIKTQWFECNDNVSKWWIYYCSGIPNIRNQSQFVNVQHVTKPIHDDRTPLFEDVLLR